MQEMSANNAHRRNLGLLFDVNDQEWRMMRLMPLYAPFYAVHSLDADIESRRRYTDNSRWYGGNGGAYRHILWNIMMRRSFEAVYYSAVTQYPSLPPPRAAVKAFTDAHEHYTEPGPRRNMDLLNNAIGLAYVDSHNVPMFMGTNFFNTIETFIDNGGGWRIDRREGDTEDRLYRTNDAPSEKVQE
jgi:hypothetical protein